MKVIRAKSAGFCWGVERAIDTARQHAANGHRVVYTDGPLIHNSQMMQKLSEEGIREVGDYESAAKLELNGENDKNAVIVVRAHGISPERRAYLKSLGLEFRDGTCPDVGIIAGKIKLFTRKGFFTVIFGDPKHPEVTGLMGYTEGRGFVVKSEADIDALPEHIGEKVCFVSQTTMFTFDFKNLGAHLRRRFPEAQVVDTICGATKERQSDIPQLRTEGAQAVVVIGGRHSANTVKLAKLVEMEGMPCYHVETAAELDFAHMKSRYGVVGVTAGASTPGFLIDDVCNKLESL
jgi:4-hydroxy-3-methylbut-2-enyl diphosphate reductase